MSRAFSSTAAAAKSLKWLPVKTTKPVDWVMRGVEEYLDAVEVNYPHLANKVSKMTAGQIRGNPHPTPHRTGRNDPFHGSGAIGEKNFKRDNRETSLHIYPDGLVKPTNEKWPTLQVTAATATELGEDAVWLDQKYCEDYASGKSNALSDQHDQGEDNSQQQDSEKGKGKDKAPISWTSTGGWEWDDKMQMNKRWATDLGAFTYWDDSAKAERYWDGTKWKWL